MRRIAAWAMSTLTVLVLLFSYSTSRSPQVVASTAQTRSATTSGSPVSSEQEAESEDDSGADVTTGSGSASGSASGSTSGSGATSGSQSSATAQTYAGDEVMTRFGVVQVQITVENGQIATSEVLQVPWSDRHDQMINSRAVPVYNEEVVAAQSADIDVVSGATVTWEGYTQSLQSAIDQANL